MPAEESVSTTDISLLHRVGRDERDESAWRAFVDQYGYRIYAWCIRRNLQPVDAEDVTQEVLLKLAKYLGSFDYDPSQSFRGWLRRVTENALNDFAQQRRETTTDDSLVRCILEMEAGEGLLEQLVEAFDLEIMEEAVRRVRKRVSEKRFRVWHRMAREGAKGADVARELNMKLVSVYTARSRIQQMIRDEIQRVNDAGI